MQARLVAVVAHPNEDSMDPRTVRDTWRTARLNAVLIVAPVVWRLTVGPAHYPAAA